MESAAKAVAALAVAVPQAHDVVLSGRSARSARVRDELAHRLRGVVDGVSVHVARGVRGHVQSGRAGRGAHRRRSERRRGEDARRTPGHSRREGTVLDHLFVVIRGRPRAHGSASASDDATCSIAGVSTRAAAESAARAGFDGDRHRRIRRSRSASRRSAACRCRATSARQFTAHGGSAMRCATSLRCGGLSVAVRKSHPCDRRVGVGPSTRSGQAARCGAIRPTCSAASAIHFCSPACFADAGSLRRSRAWTFRASRRSKEWLVKPFRSGGGHGVRRWTPDTPVLPGFYAQERIDGVPASIVFVAARGRAVPLGISRQLIGDAAFGASGYRYCGNVLAPQMTR